MTSVAYQLGVQRALAQLMKCAFSWGGAPAGPLSPMREDQLQSPGELANKAPPPGKVVKPHVTGSRALNLDWGKAAAAAVTSSSSSGGTNAGGNTNKATFGDIPGAFTGSLIDGRQTPAAAAGAPPAAAVAGGAPLAVRLRTATSTTTATPSATGGQA